MSEELGITVKKKDNTSEWYTQTIIKSGFVDYSKVSGCIVFKPLSYAIWEKLREEVDKRFKEIGLKNVYFPLFIPEKLLKKEGEHFEGFTPEVAWVTHAGKSKLSERLAVRPTSETIMYDSYSKWIRSWRDLPLRLNQWCSVVRWEFKHPTPLLRSREFLWNEGHCAYETMEELMKDKEDVLRIYQEVTEEYLALPGIPGKKSKKETFAGAVASYSIEHLLTDGKAIQGPDYHNDGDNFSKVFDITYLDKEGEKQYPVQSTFAITTRELGVMILMHGDDKGLIIPPKVAPIKVVVIQIGNDEEIHEKSKEICSKLEGCKLDNREEYTPGWKFNEWELKGVPLRIEIGKKGLESDKLTLVRRDTGEKIEVSESEIEEKVEELLRSIQDNLFKKAKKYLEDNIRDAENYEKLKEVLSKHGGFIKSPWCGETFCEEQIKEETGAKITNIPFRYQKPEGKKCLLCDKKAKYYVHFAKSY